VSINNTLFPKANTAYMIVQYKYITCYKHQLQVSYKYVTLTDFWLS